jgi:hypothetical protein
MQAPKIRCLKSLLQSDLADSNGIAGFHPRRTLDQFYYSRMEDTRARDSDQVVTRQTRGKTEGESLPKVVMIDQLWLCLYIPQARDPQLQGDDPHHASLITSFPHTSYARTDTDPLELYQVADVREQVFQTLMRGKHPDDELEPLTAIDLAATVLSEALLGPLSLRGAWSLDFLELFREAIGVVAQKHDEQFRRFQHSLRPGAARIALIERQTEVALGLEIADIIDELHMLKQLFETQLVVLKKLLAKLATAFTSSPTDAPPDGPLPRNLRASLGGFDTEIESILEKIDGNFLSQVKSMIQGSERVQKSISDLLDLQQREESVREAKRANQQALFSAKQVMSAQATADATEAQSWILFVFTIITTIFLPLSFFTALGTNKAMWASGGTIAFVFAVGAAIYYFWGKYVAAKERTMWLIDLEDKKFLPSDLIDPKDPQYDAMEKMRKRENRPHLGDGTEPQGRHVGATLTA